MGLPRRPLRLCPSRKYSLTDSGNCSTHFNEIVERKWSNVKNCNNLLPPVWIQSIVISDFVCLPVRYRDDREHYSRNYMSDHHNLSACYVHVKAVAWSSTGGVAIRYVLPVMWVTWNGDVKVHTGWVKKVSCCTVIDISKAKQYP